MALKYGRHGKPIASRTLTIPLTLTRTRTLTLTLTLPLTQVLAACPEHQLLLADFDW